MQSHPGKVQLLVAMVEYKTNLKIPRRGLCSSWLKSLPLDSRIPVKISPPTLGLPLDIDTPVILVGPGTGVAPMRALMEERARQGAAASELLLTQNRVVKGKQKCAWTDRIDTRLYFGCRSLSADYYYATEWDALRKEGAHVRVAASREGKEKVYVQNLIKEDKEMIYDWVVRRRGWLFICG